MNQLEYAEPNNKGTPPGNRYMETDENKIKVPRAARAAQGNHVFVAGGVGMYEKGHYESRPYVFQEYPKELYHPDWRKEAKPIREDYADGPKGNQEYELASRKWERAFNRTVVAKDKAEETKLVKKGWLIERPYRELTATGKAADEI